MEHKPNILFVVDLFPHVANTFIIDQISALKKRGFRVSIIAFKKGSETDVASDYHSYGMARETTYLDMERSIAGRVFPAVSKLFRLGMKNPAIALRALNIFRYGKDALSLKTVYWAELFMNRDCDLVHCHFGPSARKFEIARSILRLEQKFVTTFYGYDVSRTLRDEGPHYYDGLKKNCSAFFVMSCDMKRRLMAYGFDEDTLIVNPPGIHAGRAPIQERHPGKTVEMVSVGRLVEKKGYDDLLKALSLVKKKTTRSVRCTIVGDGPLRSALTAMRLELGLTDTVAFPGYMKREEIDALLPSMHLYIQPSKTDSSGNME